MKKIKYDLIVSIISICTAIIPFAVAMFWIESAKISGSYHSGSGHDIGLLVALFLSAGIAVFHGIMIAISAINDFKVKDSKKQNITAIIVTILNVLCFLGNVIITLLIFLPSSLIGL